MPDTYDVWGRVTVIENEYGETHEIAQINPFRYRGYYYDTETELYYLQTRYYDPMLRRFISPDNYELTTQLTTGELNMYAYCANNPVMFTDETGEAAEWLKWFGTGMAILGAVLVIAAITVLTAGVGTAALAGTLAGAAIHGAAVGTLIGAGLGVASGALIGGAVSGWSAEGILIGAGLGFGFGAVIGAAVGGIAGASSFYPGVGTHVKNPGISLSKASTHATQRMAERGVTNSMISNALKNGIAFQQTTNKFLLLTKEVAVVITKSGVLITTWSQTEFGQTISEIVKKFFGGLK